MFFALETIYCVERQDLYSLFDPGVNVSPEELLKTAPGLFIFCQHVFQVSFVWPSVGLEMRHAVIV